MKKLELNKKTIEFVVIAVVSVMSLALAYLFLYLPRSKTISQLQHKINMAHGQIEDIEKMIARVPDPKKEIQLLEERIRKLKEKSIEEEQIPRIIQQLFQKTSELNIEVVSINPKEGVEEAEEQELPEGVGKVYIEVSIRCPYKILVTYLKELSNSQLLFTIEDIDISKPEYSASENLEVKMLLSTYVMA